MVRVGGSRLLYQIQGEFPTIASSSDLLSLSSPLPPPPHEPPGVRAFEPCDLEGTARFLPQTCFKIRYIRQSRGFKHPR